MPSFEILCTTMHQTDFSKIGEMNIHSDIVLANQADTTNYTQLEFEGHTAKMITTATRGVGINRNLSLTYASADICLFADDDVVYHNDLEKTVVSEFNKHPDADIIVFHLETDSIERQQKKYTKTKKHLRFARMPWGTFRIAFRLNAVKKANIWFTPLFGGGCVFPCGEDSFWLNDAKKAGLTFYVSKETIGKVSFDTSSWFSGYNEKYFYARGAFYSAVHSKTDSLWMRYFAWRTRKMCYMPYRDKIKWMKNGRDGYNQMLSK